MRLRQKLAQAAIVAVLAASAVAYGALEKHVTVRVEGSLVQVRTFAGTVGDVLQRAHIELANKDVVRPSIATPLREGMLIEVRHAKPITLLFNGRPRQVIVTALTVEEVIEELRLRGSLADFVNTSTADRVTPGMVLVYRQAVGLTVMHDGVAKRVITNAGSVGQVLSELGVKLGGKDIVTPGLQLAPARGMVVRVLRVGTRVEMHMSKIPYKTISHGDSSLERGTHEVRQHGHSGLAQVRYRVTYKDGKRVSKVALASKVIQAATPRIVAVGTGPRCICTRGSQTGDATWYSRDGLTAAHRSLPFGTIVRVTNLANGRYVNVRINDRGPQDPDRVIDLSDDAFRRLAPLGAGVIRVSIKW